ncbi:NRDE family protein [Microbulbifer thermotolerans]|uniref:NRDE family protein n=1 Tax=Microbulbifer thermotolerans TaxID=252514 RepID=UPI00224AA36C|nr:NRDE family protein [Microbulbifer thermotolerans]MCX2835225.1 NRDE family protein [Microbulbifer thermotolerans]
MCLLLFAYRCHPRYPLLLLANRDEFYDRPAAPAAPWQGEGVVAGRDLQAGGTWAGIARGRVAAVTNIREPRRAEPEAVLSRGDIPRDFLHSHATPSEFAAGLANRTYRSFNALLFQFGAEAELVCAGNRHKPFNFSRGVHGISNGTPDAPWPKVEKGRAELRKLLDGINGEITDNNFVRPALTLLQDRSRAHPETLPNTGVGPELEMALSPIFVQIKERDGNPVADGAGDYGTRASTLVAVDDSGATQLWEQNYDNGEPCGPVRHFRLSSQDCH